MSDNLITIQEAVGARLREIRKSRKINQSDLASKVGVKLNTISRYELGEYSQITVPMLYNLCVALNISMDDFFSEIPWWDIK